MVFRKAEEKDIPDLCRIRKLQLIDEGMQPDTEIDRELDRYFRDRFADRSMVEWIAEEEGRIIATGAVLFMRFPPSYINPSGMKAYIANVYTAPDYRGQGIAQDMLARLIGEARERKVSAVWLLTSRPGRPAYRRFGFTESDRLMEYSLEEPFSEPEEDCVKGEE